VGSARKGQFRFFVKRLFPHTSAGKALRYDLLCSKPTFTQSQVLSVLGPLTAQLAHARLQDNTEAQQQQQQQQQRDSQQNGASSSPPSLLCHLLPLSGPSVALVSECIKALVAAASFVGVSQGAEGQVLALQVRAVS